MAALDIDNSPSTDEKPSETGRRALGRNLFTWSYQQKVDSQGRIQFPVKWKVRASDTDMFAIIMKHRMTKKDFLLVLPHELFDEYTQPLRELSFTRFSAMAHRHKYVKKIMALDLDGAGRFTLPAELRSAVGLDKEALLVGCLDRFELWNPKDYDEAFLKEQEVEDTFDVPDPLLP